MSTFDGHEVQFAIFSGIFVLVTVVGFAAARWRRPTTIHTLEEWGLGGRAFGSWVTWFLLGGDVYTAYTLVALPALVYAVGAAGFFAAAFFAAGFFATGFFFTAAFFAAGFFTAGFLAAGFFAAGFLTGGFFTAGFFAAGSFASTFLRGGRVGTGIVVVSTGSVEFTTGSLLPSPQSSSRL